MANDGGSIPCPLWFCKDLRPGATFPRSSGTTGSSTSTTWALAEGLKTLMEAGLCPKSDMTFCAIYAGVSSWVAQRILGGSMRAARKQHACTEPRAWR